MVEFRIDRRSGVATYVQLVQQVRQALRLDKRLRLKVAPVQLGPPFGVTFLDAPLRVPLPMRRIIAIK